MMDRGADGIASPLLATTAICIRMSVNVPQYEYVQSGEISSNSSAAGAA